MLKERSKELGTTVSNKSTEQLEKKGCKEGSKVLGKGVCKKIGKELGKYDGGTVARN